eukprot:Nk52_evm69s239 gene=Nk52_evmTU69s239
MDNSTAVDLFENGVSFILMDLPEGSEFGINYNSFRIGHRFKGVKMIPPGFHYVYFSLAKMGTEGRFDSDGLPEVSPRVGLFLYFDFDKLAKGEDRILVYFWDKASEGIVGGNDCDDAAINSDQVRRIKYNIREFEPSLGAYASMKENVQKWKNLTDMISEPLVKRVEPKSKLISTCFKAPSDSSSGDHQQKGVGLEKGKRNFADYESQAYFDSLEEDPEFALNFVKIPSNRSMKFYGAGENGMSSMDASRLSECNLDQTAMLERILKTECGGDYKVLLGEIQLAFVTFLVGQIFSGFEQWKELVTLLCSSGKAIQHHEDMYRKFLEILHYQLLETPDDFFVDIISKDNFLTVTMQRLFWNIEDYSNGDGPASLRALSATFKDYISERFQYDFEGVPEDEEPCVVEM